MFQAHYLRTLSNIVGSLQDKFDIVAGTSTGAILAGAVALDVDLQRVCDLYERFGSVIFAARPFASIRRGARYNSSGLRHALAEVFSNAKLKDCSIPLVLAATTLNTYSHRVFSSYHESDAELSIVDLLLASSAAPTFFAPARPQGEQRTYVDGGLWANSPSLVAVLQALEQRKCSPQDVRLVSVGNGEQAKGKDPSAYARLRPFSVETIRSIFQVMFAAQSASAEDLCRRLIGEHNILSVNAALDKEIALDDHVAALKRLPPLAEEHAINTANRFTELVRARGSTTKPRVEATHLSAALRAALKLAVDATRALAPELKLNARYFERTLKASRILLQRRHDLHVETDPMPKEYGLDYVIVGEDDLVICSSFLKRTPLFETLEPGHTAAYSLRIRHHIDPNQSWILACPVLDQGDRAKDPLGVVCFFSTQRPDTQAVLPLQNVAVSVCSVFSELLE